MSFFRKIKDLVMDVFKEEDLMNELCEHLRQIGIDATLLEHKRALRGGLVALGLGAVKIEGRNIDLVQVDRGTFGGDENGGVKDFIYYYHYVVLANVKGLQNKLKAKVKLRKKGLLSRQILDFKWEGGELARLLNADSELRNLMLREGLDNVPVLEIRPHEKGQEEYQRVRITKQPNLSIRGHIKVGFQSVTTLGRKEFPTLEDFEIYDRITQHIRSIATARP